MSPTSPRNARKLPAVPSPGGVGGSPAVIWSCLARARDSLGRDTGYTLCALPEGGRVALVATAPESGGSDAKRGRVALVATAPDSSVTNANGLEGANGSGGAGGVGGLLAVIVPRPMGEGQGGGGTAYLSCYDANGNISEYIATNGEIVAHYDYSPFGEALVVSGPLAATFTHRFSTKPWCADTGLNEYQMRKYRPSIGRWISRDPQTEISFPLVAFEDIGSSNWGHLLYTVNSNDNIRLVDYLGMHSIADCEDAKEFCDEGCRHIPAKKWLERKYCWARCELEYATCLATATETLVAVGCTTMAIGIIIFVPELAVPILAL